jgi:hypothetical protein
LPSTPTRSTPPARPGPATTIPLPAETAAVLGSGWGIDFDSGSTGLAYTLTGADISIGPGLEGGMVDVGDGAAIYLTQQKPARPEDCAGNEAIQTTPLPLPANADLCVLTGRGQLVTIDVTASTSDTLRFRYRIWSRTS